WSKETYDIEFRLCQHFPYIIADAAVHKWRSKFAIIIFQPANDFIVLLVFRTRVKKSFVLFVFVDHIEHALVCAVSSVEDLSFSIQYEFLEIERNCFSNAEIFRVL